MLEPPGTLVTNHLCMRLSRGGGAPGSRTHTGGLRAKLQEEYQPATSAAQRSRNRTKWRRHNQVPGAARRGPIESKAEDSMAWGMGAGGEEWPVPRAWPFSKCGEIAEGSSNMAQIRNRLLLPRKMQGKRSPSGGGDGEHLLMMDSPGKWSVRWRKTEKPPERGGLGRQRLSHRFGEHLRDDG